MRRGGLLERQPKAIFSLILGLIRDPRVRWGPVFTFLASAVLTYALIERLARPPGAEAVVPEGAPAPEQVAVPSPEAQTGLASPSETQRSVLAEAPSEPQQPEAESAPAEPPKPARVTPAERSVRVVTGRIQRGSTLAQALRGQGVPAQMIDQIARGMRPVFDFRYARSGDSFALVRNGGGKLLSFEFQQGRRDIYRLRPGQGEALLATHREVPLERRVIHLSGKVHGSLFETMVALGEGPDLVHDFADIFAWDIDFSRQTRPGDRFRAIFEKFYDRDGFVRYGKVLAAQYSTGTDTFVAVYFEDDDGYGDYYRPDGSSVRRTFLRAPVRYTRISSRYSKSRYHPILKVRRPHEGVDYAAPVGTPVWAVADGVVTFRGWSGGFGRLVKIRHPNGYTSYYGHLARYAAGIEKGSRVRQRQVVGHVGMTGLTTGPHLDYRLKANGRFVDPLRVRLPRGKPVYAKNRERFVSERDSLLRELEAAGGGGFALEALR
jgi:murein DD-endopeptidase MepM/ murein hydrolase activator NlpD